MDLQAYDLLNEIPEGEITEETIAEIGLNLDEMLALLDASQGSSSEDAEESSGATSTATFSATRSTATSTST